MKKQMMKSIGGAALAILLLAAFAQVWACAQGKAGVSSSQTNNEPSLVGTWDVEVTIRDCQTGIPFFSFPAQVTFNQDGTMQETDLGDPALVRLGGQGVWERKNGREFSSAFRYLTFNPDRTPVGRNVVRSAITLDRSGDTYTATDTAEITLPNGNVITACATETATRFR